MSLSFNHSLKLGSYGDDVSGAKRAVYRFLDNGAKWRGYMAQSQISKRTFGPWFRQDLIQAQHILTAGMVDGVFDRSTLAALEGADAFDWIARALWTQGQVTHPVPAPTLVEPKQGYHSLDKELWEDFSTAMHMGLTDLGTYNPSPSNIAINSDHAYWPSYAFDAGISPQTGWDNLTGRKFFWMMVARPEVEYVILGDKIHSKALGLHAYTHGGHNNHVHVSGIHHPGGGVFA